MIFYPDDPYYISAEDEAEQSGERMEQDQYEGWLDQVNDIERAKSENE
jgi:hypothetical protein